MALLAHQKLVGDHGGAEHYATIALCWSAEAANDYGVPLEMLCKGNVGSSNNITGTSAHGAIIHTLDVTYNAKNHTLLASASNLQINADNVIVYDLMLLNSHSWDYALTLNGNGSWARNCYIRDSASSYGAVSVYGTAQGNIEHCVINATGAAKAFKLGYYRPCTIKNNVIFGCTDTALVGSGSGANQIIENNLLFNNGVDLAGTHAGFNNNATQDNTGAITGISSAELVDFAAANYQLKATSSLATQGVDGNYIGAFLEVASSVSLSLDNSVVASSVADITPSRATALTLTNAINNVTLSELNLSAKRSLALTDSAVALVTNAITLNKQTSVTLDNSSIATTVSDTNLSRYTTLNLQSAAVNTVIDNMALTVNSANVSLAFDDVSVSCSDSTSNISRYTTLATQSAFVDVNLADIALTSSVQLGFDNSSVSCALDVINIFTAKTLQLESSIIETSISPFNVTRLTALNFDATNITVTIAPLVLIQEAMPLGLTVNIKSLTTHYLTNSTTTHYEVTRP